MSFTADGRELLIGGVGPFGEYGYLALLARDARTGGACQTGCVASRGRGDCGVVRGGWDGSSATITGDGRNLYIAPEAHGAVIALGRTVSIAPSATWRPATARVTLTLTCPEARNDGCFGQLQLRTPSGRTLARTRYDVPAGSRARVPVRVRIARAGSTPVVLARAADAAGIVRSSQGLVRLTRGLR